MTSENVNPNEAKEEIQPKKNPKRVAAGKKGVEARKIKAEFKRKEAELLKKENIELKQITKDDETFNTDMLVMLCEQIQLINKIRTKITNYYVYQLDLLD